MTTLMGDELVQEHTTLAKVLADIELTETATPSPEEELASLEKVARERGIDARYFAEIQSIGDCDDQIKQRIQALNQWLALEGAA